MIEVTSESDLQIDSQIFRYVQNAFIFIFLFILQLCFRNIIFTIFEAVQLLMLLMWSSTNRTQKKIL